MVPLFADCRDKWSPEHPFFRHAAAQHFVAVRDGRDVGRIAAAVDQEQDRVHGDRTGLFGWFECERRPETAHALLDAAAAWLRERGRDRVRGPLSYTTNGVAGLLVEDDRPGPPVIQTAYNPPWYEELLTLWGLRPVKDLLALWVPQPDRPDPRAHRIAERLRKRAGVAIRPIRMDAEGFRADVGHLLGMYNRAWERNWGFVPLAEDEFRHEAASMRPILVPDYLLFAERRGRPVGFVLGLPDFNQALARIRGRLWPWSVLTLLRWKRRIDRLRIITLGVLPESRNLGIDVLLVQELGRRSSARGNRGAECSWVLSDNRLMLSAIEQVGGQVYRRYRLYERGL